MFTGGIYVNKFWFLFLLLSYLLLQRSQPRTQKGRGKIIFLSPKFLGNSDGTHGNILCVLETADRILGKLAEASGG